ncbi:PDR/VanB family oxidoreductase [Nocardioides sp. LHG3406-4]|uniref:PDR/VanB family oxidoreductase n=1 Tax=Nocardioides sp. LHG3406-4 TaxID=2804575 RepID=UPI003CF68702
MAGTAPDVLSGEQLTVIQVRLEAAGVHSLVLGRPDGKPLPSWEPGAHIHLSLPSGVTRQYSLCGDPADTSTYTVAVLREVNGRGGSAEIHDTALVGRALKVHGPRNQFPLEDAERFLFIAGGIGITPILAMVRTALASGREWTLIYGGRTRASMAFVDELQGLAAGRVRILPEDRLGILPLREVISDVEPGTAIYACGPEGMLRAVSDVCEAKGLASRLHLERFSAGPEPVTGGSVASAARMPFEVELRRTGVTVLVPPERGLLEVVKDVVADVQFSCEEGYCGFCESRVLEGVPEHHDQILSEEEKENGDTMIICVGRSKSNRLVLDL